MIFAQYCFTVFLTHILLYSTQADSKVLNIKNKKKHKDQTKSTPEEQNVIRRALNQPGSGEQVLDLKEKKRKKERSTSSSSGSKSLSDSKSDEKESLNLSGSTSSTSKEKKSEEYLGWRVWHRKCSPCPEDMALKWKDHSIKWICGAYQEARRSFKSMCLMHYRNCQDGTMFVKIADHRCKNDTEHGEHFFYDYHVVLTDESDSSSSFSETASSSSKEFDD